jgi:hypothetical protein
MCVVCVWCGVCVVVCVSKCGVVCVCVCVCSLSYPACKAHAPYYIALCGLTPIFCILSHKQHNYCKNV